MVHSEGTWEFKTKDICNKINAFIRFYLLDKMLRCVPFEGKILTICFMTLLIQQFVMPQKKLMKENQH